ncbi:MAG: glutamate--tRNA ligase, partial [Coriobacteriia bacterium]
ALATWDVEAIQACLRALAESLGVKPKVLFQALRVAVTGSTVSPPLFESLELLGRDRTLMRVKAAL